MSFKLKILPYRSLANANKAIIRGHAFKKHPVKELKATHKKFSNFRNAVRRYQLSPLKFEEIRVILSGIEKKVTTDKRGMFECEFSAHNLPYGWHKYKVKLNGKSKKGEIFHPTKNTTAVISDIDDTVLVSHSTRLLKKMYLILFRNAHTRKLTPMIKNWTAHLQDFNSDERPKDYFYVSNSEWNLYDFLEDFFDINKLPKGVFFLQSLRKGLRDLVKTGRVNHDHKMESIEFLFSFYPNKPYILVGDNGQKDMDIYGKICEKYPDRIKGVMIRKLPYVRESYRLDRLEKQLSQYKIPLVCYH